MVVTRKKSNFASQENDYFMQELTPKELIEWKHIITDVLREFQEICKENNLRYYGTGGTAIGAVRHKGMIPWDDDIDVAMPRPDYDCLIKICKTKDLGDFDLVGPYTTKNYPVPFIKFCSKLTTLIEHENIPCITGLYIDIFPVDGTSDNVSEAFRLKRKYERIWHKLEAISCRNTFTEYISLLKEPHEWGRFAIKTVGFFFRSKLRSILLKRLESISRRYSFDDANNVIVYSGSYGKREIMPKSVYVGESVTFPFEGITIPLASGYKDYLGRIYGDYMKLPPMEQRVSHHSHAVVDMTRRLTDEEALALL